jgi:hypothetical protein
MKKTMKPKSSTDPAFQRFFKDPATIIAPISIDVVPTADNPSSNCCLLSGRLRLMGASATA